MKPLPILFAAAGLAVAASGGFLWMGNSSAAGGTKTARAGSHPGAGASADADPTAPASAGSHAKADSRVGRRFRSASNVPASGPAAQVVAANDPETASVTGGISTENPRMPRMHSTPGGLASPLPKQENHPLAQNRNDSASAGKSIVAFGALADAAPAAEPDAPTGLLPHPDLPKPAAPELAGKVTAPTAPADAASGTTAPDTAEADAARAEVPVYVSRQRGGRPPWPTGPFTPDQELYRAQVGADNFNAWLNAEARKQRPDLQ